MTKSRKKRLGRGLDALLGEASPAREEDHKLKTVPIDLLKRGQYQPRTRMDKTALEELSQSIGSRGLVQPIVVRPLRDGSYEIIAGERRWRAAQLAGLDEVPVMVRDIPDEAALVTALIENIQREDLNPVEEQQRYILGLARFFQGNRIERIDHEWQILGLDTLSVGCSTDLLVGIGNSFCRDEYSHSSLNPGKSPQGSPLGRSIHRPFRRTYE